METANREPLFVFFIGNNKESFRAPAFRGYLTYFDDQQIRKKKYLVALFVNS